jgi:hypothetical protein
VTQLTCKHGDARRETKHKKEAGSVERLGFVPRKRNHHVEKITGEQDKFFLFKKRSLPLGLGQEQEHIKTVADTEGERGHGFRAQGTSAWSNNENKSRNMCNLARIGEEKKQAQQVPFILFLPLVFLFF